MSTLFNVSYHTKGEPGNIHNEVRPENAWVFEDQCHVIATIKFDGTAAMIRDGIIFKRYDAKHGKIPPAGSIPCDEFPDPISGHWPHWVECSKDNPNDVYFINTFGDGLGFKNGTYELCGEKIGINAEKVIGFRLFKHGEVTVPTLVFSFGGIMEYLQDDLNDIEGLVFHHTDGRMCKIRKSDFGFKRPL